MNKLVFSCWYKPSRGSWEQIEGTTGLKIRAKPRWIPFRIWSFLISRLVILEATLEAKDGYIDEQSVTVKELE